MTLLTLPNESNLATTAKSSAPALHVRRRGGGVSRVVALAAGKSTIGSSPQCVVRLPAADAKPLQCVVTVEGGAVAATRWAAGVLLNGGEFSRAPLRAGDRLVIGGWDIELGEFDEATSGHELELELEETIELELAEVGFAPLEAAVQLTPVAELLPSEMLVDAIQEIEEGDEVELVGEPVEVAEVATADEILAIDELAAPARLPSLETVIKKPPILAIAGKPELLLLPAPTSTVPPAEQPIAGPESLAEVTPAKDAVPAVVTETAVAEMAAADASNAGAIDAAASQIFADRVVLELWQANHQARRRVKGLITTIRAARFQAEALTADLSAMETELDLARAAYNSQVTHDERLQQEMAEHDRLARERIAPLVEELDALRSQLDEAGSAAATFPVEVAAPVESNVAAEPASQPLAAVEPAAEYTSTSFIDKYRHILDEESDAPAAAGRRRPILDDEYLSPAKASASASPPDESDEALEAYMASMMSRMRASSPSYASSQAATLTTPSSVEASPTSAAAISAAESASDEPFVFEAMKHPTLKAPQANDLTALREIANNSARSAIATHRQRRSLESALGRGAIALGATVSAALLLASAPSTSDWQFWAGAVTGVVAIGAAVQVLRIVRRRAVDRRGDAKLAADACEYAAG